MASSHSGSSVKRFLFQEPFTATKAFQDQLNKPNRDVMGKFELADEIALLKESNNKLLKELVQKERECRELQDRLILSSKTNSELMDELAELTTDNQRFKLQGVAVREENITLRNQLSHVRKMYTYSFPKGPVSVWESRRRQPSHPEKTESWEEVSEKLLQQMKAEMMEIESMNASLEVERNSSLGDIKEENFASRKSGVVPSSIAFSDECELKCAKSLIHHLKSQVEHLKNQAVTQGALLGSALEQLKKFAKASDTPKLDLNLASSSKRFSHPSDELFRAYFTKQLHNNGPNIVPTVPLDSQRLSTEADDKSKTLDCPTDKEDKICPICEAKFPQEIEQSDFEYHVFAHLDRENTLLLEQYEMV